MNNNFPWYMQIFNTELLNQVRREWEKEAKERGLTLEEYIAQRQKVRDKE